MKSIPNQNQTTLDVEDLEIQRIMLEIYYVQPSNVSDQSPQHISYDKVKSTTEN